MDQLKRIKIQLKPIPLHAIQDKATLVLPIVKRSKMQMKNHKKDPIDNVLIK
jgi:hypothetical protein